MSTKLLRSRYQYGELWPAGEKGMDVSITVNGYWLEQMYYPYWKRKMREAGKHELISLENCIEDWVIVNWAWKIM